MWSSNSCAKYRIPDSSGLTAVRSRPHSAPSRMSAERLAHERRVGGSRAAGAEAVAQLREPARADAAGDGLAARLVVEIAREQRGQVHDAGGVVDDHARVPEPRMAPASSQLRVAEGRVQRVGRQEAARGAADEHRLERARRAAARLLDDVPQRSCPWAPRRCPAASTAPLSWTSVVPGSSGAPIAA